MAQDPRTIPLRLRRALSPDAAALASLAEQTFRDAFSAHTTASDMDMFCAATYSEARQAAEIADPLVETWLVADDRGGEPVAYFQLRSGDADEAPPGCAAVELWRFYVRHDWHGRGVAPLMMAHAFARARALGRDAIWLGVWEHNARALAFYTRSGFVTYGDHPFVLGTDHQRDLLLYAPVTSA